MGRMSMRLLRMDVLPFLAGRLWPSHARVNRGSRKGDVRPSRLPPVAPQGEEFFDCSEMNLLTLRRFAQQSLEGRIGGHPACYRGGVILRRSILAALAAL